MTTEVSCNTRTCVQLDEKFPPFRRTVFKITKISDEANCIVNSTNTAHSNCVTANIKNRTTDDILYIYLCAICLMTFKFCRPCCHLGIILVNNQLDAQFFFLYVYFNSLYVSSNLVLIIRRVNCINTTSGICHSV
jgi:hypothetical protein